MEPSSVGHLADRLPISQPAVSQHLRVLQEAELVDVRRDGTRRIYSLKQEGLEELRAYVERFWTDALEQFAVAAEAIADRGEET